MFKLLIQVYKRLLEESIAEFNISVSSIQNLIYLL